MKGHKLSSKSTSTTNASKAWSINLNTPNVPYCLANISHMISHSVNISGRCQHGWSVPLASWKIFRHFPALPVVELTPDRQKRSSTGALSHVCPARRHLAPPQRFEGSGYERLALINGNGFIFRPADCLIVCGCGLLRSQHLLADYEPDSMAR